MNTHPLLQKLFILTLLTLFTAQVMAQNEGFSESALSADLRDISASGTFVPLSDDAVSGAVPIGFTFNFYGNNYTQVYISSNGFFSFSSGQGNGCCSGDDMPDPGNPNNVVAGFWEDFNLPQGNIRYETLGSAPNQEFVVGFYDNPHYFDGLRATFEMILLEGSNNIEFQYGDAPSDGGTHTVGVEDANGFFAYLVARGNLSFENVGILLTPEPIDFVPVPTLSGTGLAVMVLLLSLFGFAYFRKRQLYA